MEMPLAVGMGLGTHCVAGFMVGTLVSGIMLAMSMNSSGASWEGAKRYLKGPPKTNASPPAAAPAPEGSAAPPADNAAAPEGDAAPPAEGATTPAETQDATQEATTSAATTAPATAKEMALDSAGIAESVGY